MSLLIRVIRIFVFFREKSLGDNADDDILKNYEHTLVKYDEYCNILNKAGQQDSDVVAVAATKIEEQLQELFKLKHFGQKLKSLYYCQKKAFESERNDDEYIHRFRLKMQNARRQQGNNYRRGRSQTYRRNNYQNRQYYPMNDGRNWHSQSACNQQEFLDGTFA